MSEEKVLLGADEKFCSSCGKVVKKKAVICPSCGVKQSGIGQRSRIATALFALFLGGFGIHKFYLGKPGQAIFYILFCWTFIPSIIAFVEFIIYITMSDENFDEKYNS